MKWMPIESAPKDGTRVDLWVSMSKGHEAIQNGCRVTKCWWDDQWVTIDDGAESPVVTYAVVTHWMPLPEPPNED